MGPLGYLRAVREERRRLGWRGLVRKRGWSFVLFVVFLYLVRDLLLYVLVPLAVAAGIWH
jgi:hypothetical protein